MSDATQTVETVEKKSKPKKKGTKAKAVKAKAPKKTASKKRQKKAAPPAKPEIQLDASLKGKTLKRVLLANLKNKELESLTPKDKAYPALIYIARKKEVAAEQAAKFYDVDHIKSLIKEGRVIAR